MEGFVKGTVKSTENRSVNKTHVKNLMLVFSFMLSEKIFKLVDIKGRREQLNWKSCQRSSCTLVVTIKLTCQERGT